MKCGCGLGGSEVSLASWAPEESQLLSSWFAQPAPSLAAPSSPTKAHAASFSPPPPQAAQRPFPPPAQPSPQPLSSPSPRLSFSCGVGCGCFDVPPCSPPPAAVAPRRSLPMAFLAPRWYDPHDVARHDDAVHALHRHLARAPSPLALSPSPPRPQGQPPSPRLSPDVTAAHAGDVAPPRHRPPPPLVRLVRCLGCLGCLVACLPPQCLSRDGSRDGCVDVSSASPSEQQLPPQQLPLERGVLRASACSGTSRWCALPRCTASRTTIPLPPPRPQTRTRAVSVG
mmetsp:Transcript_11879/g.25438  ORF Transcript_11879/g.25438 Transcript_11879/m.25438 type:complete len:284 (-) Transcript_11879:380-1231(-)